MEARTLNCPNCGAATNPESTKCAHCGTRLATTSCPSCFSLMFVGEKFCANCGATAARAPLDTNRALPCPRCVNHNLHAVAIGDTHVQECAKCDGLWIDNATFQDLCAKREQQVVFMGIPSLQDPAVTPINKIEPVRYLKCPSCAQLMNRVNFAGCSGVIVDVCRTHGTWFDHVELRSIINFIHSGGMDKARDREIRKLVQEQNRVTEQRVAAGVSARYGDVPWTGTSSSDEWDVVTCVGRIVWDMLRRL